jgi:hypothetical protein
MKKLAAVTLSLFLMSGAAFADSPKDAPKEGEAKAAKAAVKTNAQIAKEVEELRQSLQMQQEQLQMLKDELAKRDRQIEEARRAAADADARAAAANAKAADAITGTSEAKSGTAALSTTVSDLRASTDSLKAEVTTQAADAKKALEHGPATIRYKGVNITPGGFTAAETVNRQHALSGFASPFQGATGLVYPGNGLSPVSEMNLSAAQSRLTVLAESKIGAAKITGYFENDFLGAAITSNNRQTNSYVFRMRQAFGRVEFDNGWAFTGGQMWSLAAENKKGIVNRQEALPVMIDPNYVVGFTWARANAVRVTKSFGDKFTFAASVEGPQTTIVGHGFSSYTSTTATGVNTIFTNFFLNAPGQAAGLYNSLDATGYTVNKLPDFLVKAAWDPGWGHYEVFGLVSEFRNRVYPCAVVGTTAGNTPTPATPTVLSCTQSSSLTPSAAGARNDSRSAGGFGVSASAPFFQKKLDVSLKAVYGDGIGRYGAAQLPDVTARPNGTLAPIHDAMWLGKLEWHTTPKLDIYAYVGGEYAARASYSGYDTVKVTVTPAIPGCGAVGQPACTGAPAGTIQYPVPAITTTSISTTGIGGYGNRAANNTGCSTATPPIPAGLAGGAQGSAGSAGFPGASGSCNGDARYIGEGTLGFWHRIYQGERGRVQWGMTYSYLYKSGWSGTGGLSAGTAGLSPKAVDNMVFTSFRYYFP